MIMLQVPAPMRLGGGPHAPTALPSGPFTERNVSRESNVPNAAEIPRIMSEDQTYEAK